MGIFDVSASSLFVTASSQRAQMESIAQRVLGNGLELFVAKKYDDAIATFKRAIGLAPQSNTAINAYDYMARSFLSKGEADKAVEAYGQSLKIDPQRAETHVSLGNLYISREQPEKASQAYEKAVALDPSAVNRYSLGQAYLETGRYDDAEQQFRLVRELTPNKPNGDYGMGLVHAKQGQSAEAITAFQRALAIDRDFAFAQVELGYVLADIGERDRADEIVSTLTSKASDLADTLSQYIYEKTPPEMVAVESNSTFPKTLGPKTQVSALGNYLDHPGDQRTFSMVFLFSKPMDAASVENVMNWAVTRSVNTGRADGYNFGFAVPDSEISLSRFPVSVSYDETYQTATVLFTIRQNESASGTLDPSHIKFAFSGTDATGLSMNPKADEYTGFTGFA